ncbi:MAG TPA: sugar phosphate nucleotidyltransferase [Methanocorpusculum sp.]|nr:sugar phosphate nucleotidyltransferase [Methanocorpusculum sp.]HJJ38980.1 sugar phosphate nucleotidyltransferase [Methanocorpusculum sp.]
MQCVILAAGEGSRMRPLTTERPKVMLSLAGKPILEHLIENVKAAGISDIILVTGYHAEAVKSHFGNGDRFGVTITYVVQKKQLGTADALRQAEAFVKDTFLMLNGDMLLDTEDLQHLVRMKAPVMAVSTTTHPQDFGVVTLSGKKISSLEEKSLHPKSDIINAGAYLFDAGIFELLKKVSPSTRGEYELTDALAEYIAANTLSAHRLSLWVDVGYPWDMLTANEYLLSRLKSRIDGAVEDHVFIKGTVVVGKNTTIKSGTYIEGPVVIGDNCDVGPNAYLRPGTTVGNNCHIGHAVEIKNSIVFDGTKIPHYNYIGDSVIGSECNFGAGTKIANLRHDKGIVKVGGISTGRKKFGAVVGDKVLFGINCSINTGSSIGSGTKVAPGAVVSGIVENNTAVQ